MAEKFPARERDRAQILLQMKDIEKKFNAEKFDELTDYYDLDDPRFSVFQDFPPATLMHKEDVLLTAKKASHELEKVSVRFKDINVDFFHRNIALVTYTYRGKALYDKKDVRVNSRGSLLMQRKNHRWLVVHEHTSFATTIATR